MRTMLGGLEDATEDVLTQLCDPENDGRKEYGKAARSGAGVAAGGGPPRGAPARRGSSVPGLIPSSSRSSAPARELARAVRQLLC